LPLQLPVPRFKLFIDFLNEFLSKEFSIVLI